MRGEVEQVFLLLGWWQQFREILRIDEDMTGRTGHYAFACAFERLARGPGDVEQPLPRFRFHFLVQGTVDPEKPHERHAKRCSCVFAAAAIW